MTFSRAFSISNIKFVRVGFLEAIHYSKEEINARAAGKNLDLITLF